MKSIHYLTALFFLFAAPSHALLNSGAKPGSAEFLISACQEYTELYEKKDQPRFGAFLTTSKEESFRAGYCLGAIMHTNHRCYSSRSSVYRAAQVIASIKEVDFYTESRLLERAVCH